MANPFLAESFSMRWSTYTPDCVVADVTAALAQAKAGIAAIAEQDLTTVTFASTVGALENASVVLNRAWNVVAHLDSVCNSADLLMPPKNTRCGG